MDQKTIQAANEILLRFVTDVDAKLRFGAKMRQQIVDALDKGEDPKGYRWDFLNETSTNLFAWLAERAQEFDAAYPQDKVSAQDMADILALAQMKLKAKISG